MFLSKMNIKPHLPHVRRILRAVSTSSSLGSEELAVHRDSKDNNPNTPFNFTEANMERLEAIIKNYPVGFQRSALAAAVDLAQRQAGWLPVSAMHRVAEVLDMPRMRVYEWATFYTMVKRRFKGKYNIKVCVTTPCMLRGSDQILEVVEKATCCRLGEVSRDGLFGVETVQCQGACVNAPVLVVDDDYYEDVTPDDVCNIINSIRLGTIPSQGPQNGRYAAEPVTGLTTLCGPPPCPGHGLQKALC
ncbi:unnamed protein product [Plutella xylostella]|uniref:(diamondback moth) hypothetical protein n=1 Tax=Plutella xylostella TaxID=51655 RepID=A0A8S4ER61_PLUXY|nr:unnamed protein product [Plutella xylostella]